nr:type II toxin-antitoxin system HicB family antitoxin [Treponema denticola]
MKYAYTAIFTEKDSTIYARVPDLKGCITTGKNLQDAIEQMEDAMAAWLCVAEDEHFKIAKATPQHLIAHEKNDVLSIIRADTSRYRAIVKNKAVRKNVTIPAWLVEAAEKANLNFSQELQNAIKNKLEIAL